MALTKETGALVAGADTYVDAPDVGAYATKHNLTFSGTTAELEAAIRSGLDFIESAERFRFRGTRRAYSQRTQWPRDDATTRDGVDIPATAVPWQVSEAQCLAAILVRGGTDLHAALARGGRITNKKVDSLSVTYADDAPAETIYPRLWGLLRDVTCEGEGWPEPALYQTDDTTPFVAGEYANPAAGGDYNPLTDA